MMPNAWEYVRGSLRVGLQLEVDQVLPSRYACHLNDLSGLVETLQLTTLIAAARSQEQAQCCIPSCTSCSEILQELIPVFGQVGSHHAPQAPASRFGCSHTSCRAITCRICGAGCKQPRSKLCLWQGPPQVPQLSSPILLMMAGKLPHEHS